MSLNTLCQVILLSLFILADSYLFALDLFDGRDHHRIPLGLPSPLDLYPGMFDPAVLPIIHKENIRDRPYRPPFTSDNIHFGNVPKVKVNKATTTEAPPPVKDETEEDLSAQEPDLDREVFLMKNVKNPEIKDSSVEDDKLKAPKPNSLSIHEDPNNADNWSKETAAPDEESSKSLSDFEQERNGTNDSELNKNSDYLVIPVNAINPAVLNLAPNSNTMEAKTGDNNIGLRDQSSSPTLISLYNNLNTISSNQPSSPAVINLDNNLNTISSNQPNSYINVPLGNNNGVPNNVYTLVTIPNNANQPNNFYVQPNNPLGYNIVPLNNVPTGNYQPNTYAIINNQLVPINNQPFNIFPISNQPNFVSINGQPNNFLPINNQPINLVPINNQPNNLVPVNNQPTNLNNQANNFVPLNNQPINVIPVNNVPSNFVPANNNNQPISYDSSNNNFVPNNVVTLNNQPNNYVPANLIPINNVPANNQPINNDATFGSVLDNKSNTPNNYVPNTVVSLTPIGTVSYTRDQDDDDESDKKDVEIKSDKDEE